MGTEAALSDERLLGEIHAAAVGVRAELERLTDESVRQPSELPGWSRGHIFAHLEGIADALARQVESARRGEEVDLYDGGQPARDRAIEDRADASADEHRERVGSALNRVLADFDSLEPEQWELPVRFRNGAVRDVALAVWRELVIHHSDLGTGCTQQEWGADFCRHLLNFLEPRVPESSTFVFETHAGEVRLGDGNDVVLFEGRLEDVAAWLAGRRVGHGAVRAEREGAAIALPEIGPWPSAFAFT
ncbi:maleylpyruvate isomerase family mycothiol-dependent enzyme [Sinomonas sp. ASV322]|uniref:maleylpyruvate isomerase family mycothiol-dependent enzyme n=1 Tax=Sinomonas sp. ASV322 TaxID=3041920 RepID=UPI0027DB4D2E|nr:maleylpyruvate isomerase family mycothiol-dependent enzyme [Sinomonas sp. ASV322]MDQ4502630.1 maleylpyruvate isomerase family mycothiol-dependent enzyme [Sinomonas sp. ASV322]